jgi:hypothetical protein
MTSRLVALTRSLLIVLFALSAVSVTGATRVSATSTPAIVVLSHGFAKQVNYTQGGHLVVINTTSTFTQDDHFVYAYFTAELYSANVTWLWYEPDGQLFLNRTQELECTYTPCSFVYYFALRYSAARNMYGLWTMTLQAGSVDLYSDHFTVIPVILQDVSWNFNITQSLPPRAHGSLTVTIHPNNGTWSYYVIDLPFAANITAYDFLSHRPLDLMANKTGRVVVSLGAARPNGYRFVLSFDVASGLWRLSAGVFVFRWAETGWGTFIDGYHSVPGTFNISLPANATFLDAVGINAIALNPNLMGSSSRSLVSLEETLPAGQTFGWTMLYNDSSAVNSQPTSGSTTPVAGGLNSILAQPIGFLPLTLGSLSLWTAVMSIFLLVGSELLAPAYGKTGVPINRRRLRIAALTLVILFIAVTAYAIILQQSVVAQFGH